MATQNVKILLRRGLRDEMTTETLHTGEMGFTTDTNQLYVGTDDAINEIQFEPFANAHAIIQSWLDGYEEDNDGNVISDCPYPGLDIDEDLIIRLKNNEDINKILNAMRFFEQDITLSIPDDYLVNGKIAMPDYKEPDPNITGDQGNPHYLSDDDYVYQYYKERDGTVKRVTYGQIIPDGLGTISNNEVTLILKMAESNSFTAQNIVNSATNNHTFRIEKSIESGLVDKSVDPNIDDNTVKQIELYFNEQNVYGTPQPIPYFNQDQLRILDRYFDVKRIKVSGGRIKRYDSDGNEKTVHESYTLDTQYLRNDVDPVSGFQYNDFTFEYDETSDAKEDHKLIIKINDTSNNSDDYAYTKVDDEKNLDLVETKSETDEDWGDGYQPTDDNNAFPINTEWYDDLLFDNGKDAIKVYVKDGSGDYVLQAGPDNPPAAWNITDDKTKIVFSQTLTPSNPNDEIKVKVEYEFWREIKNDDGHVFFNVELDDSDNFWFSFDKTTPENTKLKAISVSGPREFQASLFGKPRRNVEVLTENSFNQMFADQHLSSLDATTGLRSSLNRKVLHEPKERMSGEFVVGRKHKIKVLGTLVDWNDIAGTENITYNVGDEFIPVKKVETIVPGTYDYTGSNFALNKWDGTSWQTQTVDLLQDAPGTGNVKAEVNGHAYPIDAYGNDDDFAVVASTRIIVYYQKLSGVWQKLGVDTFTAQPTYSETAPTTAPDGIAGDLWIDTSSLSLKLNNTIDVTTIYTDPSTVDNVNNEHWILLNENLNHLTHGVKDLLTDAMAVQLEDTFLKYDVDICTTYFIDYSLVQKEKTENGRTYLRTGQIKVVNPHPLMRTLVLPERLGTDNTKVKLTDDNTEIWWDDGDNIAEADEFSNIEFTADVVKEPKYATNARFSRGYLHIKYTQLENFETEISYTVKRWSM